MGESMQVLAVTHLPQIAAAGEDHFYIYKEHGEASTRSYIRHLTTEERIDEIARMQSGSKLTDVTRAAAKALLETAPELSSLPDTIPFTSYTSRRKTLVGLQREAYLYTAHGCRGRDIDLY